MALNEIDTIRYALDELFSVNSQLDEKVKSTLPIMRENLLFELVNGNYLNWDDFVKDAAPYGVSFNYPFVAVAILFCETGAESIAAAENYCRTKEMPEGLQGYFFNSIYNREIVLVCSHDRDVRLKSYLMNLQREITEQTGIRTLIGVGAPEESPEGVHLSYLQAVRAAEHLRVRNQYSVLVFNEIEVPTSTVSYFAEQLQSLELFILKNDVDAIQSVVERIIEYIRSDGAPPHIVRAVYLNTVTVIFNGLQRFRHEDQDLLKSTDVAFTHRYTIEQMVQIMRESSCRLCVLIRAVHPPSRSASMEEVLAFIEKRGMDHDFSLQLIADHFNMSISNFSHYFKRMTGENFKDYVNRYRIQTSIDLLRRSDETLESIALKAGYSNTSSFIRSFKKLVGVTPGQYRESNRLL
jgi:YesN/AraC family two-component response regulator